MEVLDPSVSRDDQPLCINDSLERGDPRFLSRRPRDALRPSRRRRLRRCRCPRSRNYVYFSAPRARVRQLSHVALFGNKGTTAEGSATRPRRCSQIARKWKRSICRCGSHDPSHLPPVRPSRETSTRICQIYFTSAELRLRFFFALLFQKNGGRGKGLIDYCLKHINSQSSLWVFRVLDTNKCILFKKSNI